MKIRHLFITGWVYSGRENKEILPPFFHHHDEQMKVIYRAVLEQQQLLKHVPCYCGCGDSVKHAHNYHCFIHENKDDGSIVWDDYATRCQICLDIVAESIVENNDGKTIDEVRTMIEEKYEVLH